MRGLQHVQISNRDVKFKFDIRRNITIVRGDSGTGKTTLYDMIADYTRLQERSGVNISCEKKCVALVDLDWQHQLHNTKDSIVFIDEGAEYIKSKKFAEEIRKTDNYYVIFSRENLHDLPYSVEEIYEIKTSGKYHSFKPMYKSNKKHIYYKDKAPKNKKFNMVLTEDAKSGLEFYENYFEDEGIKCYTSNSNSAIYAWLKQHADEKVFVVADGAAFGSQIDRILKMGKAENYILCLPESFEWLILKSGIIKDLEIEKMLENPEEYIESEEYFSWEKYFAKYLIDISRDTPFQYQKKELNSAYKNKINAEKIIKEIYS